MVSKWVIGFYFISMLIIVNLAYASDKRSGDNWFRFHYDITQYVKEETISGLDFDPCLDLMIWNDGFESGKMLIEVK